MNTEENFILLPKLFFERVFVVVCFIPKGRVTNYGSIGKFLSATSSSRMVGWAMNQSHSWSEYIPAHRVVNRNGYLTGKHHFAGSNLMQELLENEGIEIAEDKVVNFKKHFWDPSQELIILDDKIGLKG